jgi:hypothetical protein
MGKLINACNTLSEKMPGKYYFRNTGTDGRKTLI